MYIPKATISSTAFIIDRYNKSKLMNILYYSFRTQELPSYMCSRKNAAMAAHFNGRVTENILFIIPHF
jgi:hypothetical protein